MRQLPATKRDGELVESLKQFLSGLSIAAPASNHCLECGSPVCYLQTQLWLLGEEKGWDIQLPYCPRCQPMQDRKDILAA